MPDPIPVNRNVGEEQPPIPDPAGPARPPNRPQPPPPRPQPRPRPHLAPAVGWITVVGVLVIVLAVANSHSTSPVQPGSVPSSADGQIGPTQGDQPTEPVDTPTEQQPTAGPPPTSEGIVQLAQGTQADPRAVAVGTMFNTYFSGINVGDYSSALSVEDPAGALNPGNASEVQQFEQGVQTTYDSQIVLVSLGPGDTTSPATSAIVTFQSTQQSGYGPADNPDETCTTWSLTYVLTPEPDGSYLIHSVESVSDQGC